MMRPTRTLRRSRRTRRRGYALVLFALLFFGLMALAALVIDLGLARMTQRQMQTAVDSAAIEGLRGRNSISDDERRQNASDLVAQTFDDDFDLGSDQHQFGAGPRINFTGGIAIGPNFNASELMSLPDPTVYDPVLQTNTNNEPDGDMVAGTYDETAMDHEEQPDYSRVDFTPASNGTPPEQTDAFLVRMRRSNEPFLTPDGARSNERPIPYLFGRGSLLAVAAKGGGITVRATAIADARPAMSAGKSNPDNAVIGVAALFIDQVSWMGDPQTMQLARFAANTQVAIRLRAGTDPIVEIADTQAEVGSAFEPTAMGRLVSFGEQLSPQSPDDLAEFLNAVYHSAPPSQKMIMVPIVANEPAIADRVIGFGWADISPGMNGELLLTKRQSRIAPANASVALVRSLDSMQFDVLFAAHKRLSQPEQVDDPLTINALLAPALAR